MYRKQNGPLKSLSAADNLRQAGQSLGPNSSSMTKFNEPQIKRFYSSAKRRYKAEDLVDNDNSGSIWAGNGQGSFLFSKNTFKRTGDILVINVQKNLKREISAELARAFPPRALAGQADGKPEGKGSEAGKPAAPAPAPPAEQAATDGSPEDKVYDRISSVIIEEINKDHLLFRGRKDVLHNKSKRTVEIQGLISRRDITDADAINSMSIIESNVSILR